jgi:hypothetical protein
MVRERKPHWSELAQEMDPEGGGITANRPLIEDNRRSKQPSSCRVGIIPRSNMAEKLLRKGAQPHNHPGGVCDVIPWYERVRNQKLKALIQQNTSNK